MPPCTVVIINGIMVAYQSTSSQMIETNHLSKLAPKPTPDCVQGFRSFEGQDPVKPTATAAAVGDIAMKQNVV